MKTNQRNLLPKLRGLEFELARANRPVPGLLPPPLTGDETDEELTARIDILAVSTLIHHSPASRLKESVCQAVLLDMARRQGVNVPYHGKPTLADLRHEIDLNAQAAGQDMPILWGEAHRIDSLASFDRLAAVLQLPPETPLANVFVEPHFSNFASLLPTAQNADKEVAEDKLEGLRRLAQSLIDRAEIPATFSAAFEYFLKLSGKRLAKVAIDSGLGASRLRKWLAGAQPKPQYIGDLEALEEALGIEAGMLSQRVNGTVSLIACDDILTQEVKDQFEAVGIPMCVLPRDWPLRTDEQKTLILEELYDRFSEPMPFKKYLRAVKQQEKADEKDQTPFRYVALFPQMQLEFDELAEFKTTRTTNDLTKRTTEQRFANKIYKRRRKWRQISAKLMEGHIQRILTAIIGASQNQQAMTEILAQCGLGCLASRDFLESATEAIGRRRYSLLKAAGAFTDLGIDPAETQEDEVIYTFGDVNRLIMIRGLFDKKTGYLYHHRPQVVAIPGIISDEWVERANSNWPRLLEEAREAISELIEDIRDQAIEVRNPWLPIEPLLSMDRPLDAVEAALKRMDADRPDFFASPVHAAKHDEQVCLCFMLFDKALRRQNWPRLTYRPETNDGHLRWVEGRLQIHIPQSEIKNQGSANLPSHGRPLIVEFSEDNQELYNAILRWINMSRAIVHGDSCGDFLFPGQGASQDDDFPVCDNTISYAVFRFSVTYLMAHSWRPGGVPGVQGFGPHGVRHLIYTHFRKITKDRVAAADAIGDTPDHAEALYWFRTSVEKSRRLNKIRSDSRQKTGGGLNYEMPPERFPWMSSQTG